MLVYVYSMIISSAIADSWCLLALLSLVRLVSRKSTIFSTQLSSLNTQQSFEFSPFHPFAFGTNFTNLDSCTFSCRSLAGTPHLRRIQLCFLPSLVRHVRGSAFYGRRPNPLEQKLSSSDIGRTGHSRSPSMGIM